MVPAYPPAPRSNPSSRVRAGLRFLMLPNHPNPDPPCRLPNASPPPRHTPKQTPSHYPFNPLPRVLCGHNPLTTRPHPRKAPPPPNRQRNPTPDILSAIEGCRHPCPLFSAIDNKVIPNITPEKARELKRRRNPSLIFYVIIHLPVYTSLPYRTRNQARAKA